MNFIDLNSVGSTITNEGLVFPIDCSEAPETASEADEMMGVNVFECDDEWYYSLSLVDGYNLFSFLEEHLGYTEEWRERVHGLMGSYDTLVAVA